MDDKEKFVTRFGWKRVDGKKVNHEGFSEEFDWSYWETDALDGFITDCVFWEDADGDRATEDMDEVMDFVEDENDILFEDWKKIQK